MRNYERILHKSFKQHMFWIFVRIASIRLVLCTPENTDVFITLDEILMVFTVKE